MSSSFNGPKAFISYSWTNDAHAQWVLDFATRLRDNGIAAILDKWDLQDGHDKYKFMERMVTDPDVRKVIIVADETYARKTDERKGGVGTEAQIISAEIYNRAEQSKFLVVVKQFNEKHEPYLPTYYKSRIYRDLSTKEAYEENFEHVLRFIFDRPAYVRPPIGRPPAFVNDEASLPSDLDDIYSGIRKQLVGDWTCEFDTVILTSSGHYEEGKVAREATIDINPATRKLTVKFSQDESDLFSNRTFNLLGTSFDLRGNRCNLTVFGEFDQRIKKGIRSISGRDEIIMPTLHSLRFFLDQEEPIGSMEGSWFDLENVIVRMLAANVNADAQDRLKDYIANIRLSNPALGVKWTRK